MNFKETYLEPSRTSTKELFFQNRSVVDIQLSSKNTSALKRHLCEDAEKNFKENFLNVCVNYAKAMC